MRSDPTSSSSEAHVATRLPFRLCLALQATLAVPLNPVASVAPASINPATAVVANVVRVNLVAVAVVAVAEVAEPPVAVAVVLVAGPMMFPVAVDTATAQSAAFADEATVAVTVCCLLCKILPYRYHWEQHLR